MRFRCFVVSCFLLPGFGFASSNIPDSISSEPVVIERQLSSGAPCTISIQSAGKPSIAVLANGAEIHVPAECLADLSDCNVPDGVQISDFAGDIFLLLAGGQGDSSWRAKLTIRDNRVTERELQRGDGPPTTATYARPLDVHEGRIPPDEIQRIQNDSRSRKTAAGKGSP
jgi:hypothetical protein